MAEGGVPSSGVLMKALGRRLCFLDEEASAVRIFFPVRPWPKKPYPVHWIAPLMALFMSAVSLRAAVEWQQDFEGSTNGWTTGGSANVWQIGKPTSGPGMAHSGTNCAGTILNGDYPDNVSASLFSPQFVVPAAVQQPRLRFWSWHNTCSAGDYGQVWIRPDGGAWTNLTEHITGPGGAWTQRIIDLSAYGGQNVQIAFQFVSDQFSCPRPGWYIDDVSVEAGPLTIDLVNKPEGFENDWGNWSETGGVWQIGKPTSGPGMAHSGTNCAGTILNGDYPDNVSASLFSPQFVVPAAVQQPRLRFWSWHNTSSAGDYGQVWIRPDGGAWTNLTEHITGPGGAWTQRIIDLSAYGGQNVQIAFQFVSDQFSCPRPGWYIDDVSVEAG